MGLHAFLTAVLDLLFFSQNISQTLVKKPSRCLVGYLKHIKGKVGISHISYIAFPLVLHLSKCLLPFRTAHGTPLPFDRGNKRLVTIVHWRCYTTVCCEMLSNQFSSATNPYQLSAAVQDQSFT